MGERLLPTGRISWGGFLEEVAFGSVRKQCRFYHNGMWAGAFLWVEGKLSKGTEKGKWFL